MTSYEESVNGFYTFFIKTTEKQVDASETLTIEEWKAERKLFVKQFSVNNFFLLVKGEEINLRIKSSNNNNVTWPWSQLKAMHFLYPPT